MLPDPFARFAARPPPRSLQVVPFVIDFSGEFGPEDLTIVWRDEPRPPHPQLDRLVSETWDAFAAECRKNQQQLYNGPMVRLLRWTHRDGRWHLEAGPTDYANYIGTNHLNYKMGDLIGWEFFADPLGTSALIITSDRRLVLGRRGRHLAVCPGMLHLFGGTMDPSDRLPDGRMDAFGCVRRELDEELSIRPTEIASLKCMGMVREATTRQPELIFACECTCSYSDLRSRLRPGHPEEEHAGLECCLPGEREICDFVAGAGQVAAVAAAALGIYGRCRFGEDWYAAYLRIF